MTITDTTTATEAQLNGYIEVDPTTLVLGPNVRPEARLSKSFIASIRERGVLEPVVCYRDDDGALIVQFGQRRTLGAIEAGRAVIPVTIVPKPAEPDRLVDQVSENEHREALTAGERVAAYEQLAVLGLSAAQIAKRTATKRTEVDAGLTVAASPLAKGAAVRWEFLTLDQAAVLAEFESDTEAVKALVAGAQSGRFDHVAQRLRDDRAEAEAIAAIAAELANEGITVIDAPPHDSAVRRLGRLTHDGDDLAAEAHRSCPGHAAFVTSEYVYPTFSESDEDDTDDEDGPQLQRVPVYVCTDPEAHGHVDRYASNGSGRADERRPMTDDEKAERKVVIENNRAWRSATTVRREWLATFAARKTAPADVERFIATALLAGDHTIRQAMENNHSQLRELLGQDGDNDAPSWMAGQSEIGKLIEQVATGTPKRALVLTAALLLAAWEAKTGPHTWRNGSADARRYLGQMVAWGYEASEVEQLILTPAGED